MTSARPLRGPTSPSDAPASRQGTGVLASAAVVVVAAVAYVALLHAVYQYVIAPQFTYLRYAYREPDPLGYAFAILLVVVLALVLPRRMTRVSHLVAWGLFVVTVAPSLVVPQFADVLSRSDSVVLAVWVALSFLPVAVFGTRGAIRGLLPVARVSPFTFWTGVVILSAAAYAYVIASVGVRFTLPSLDNVYVLRAEYNLEQTEIALLGYVVPLLVNLLNPLVIARGLLRGRITPILLGIVGQLFIFSITGYRAALLSPFAMLATYLLFRRSSRPAASLALIGAVGLVLVMWGLDGLSGSNDYTSLLVRRLLVTPGLLTAGYVSVFSGIDKVGWSHSFLSAFSSYPYAAEPPLLVGDLFFNRPDTNANASFLADGFANLGFPGMIIEGLVLTVLLCLVDDACRGLSIRVGSLLLVMETLALADSGVFTVMLTHGLVATILTCALMPSSGWTRPSRRGRRAREPG